MNDGAHSIEPLRVFRNRFYAWLGRRADALFELCDAILTAGRVPSPPHLSLVSVHRRGWGSLGWGSLYAALRKGGVDEEGIRNLRACCPLGRLAARTTPLFMPWIFRSGPAATRRRAPGGGTSTTHLVIRRDNPSLLDGPTSS